MSAFLNVWNNVWPYLVAILLFIILIIIHEFGHFIAAKLLGVRVNEFAVGFGPKLFKKKLGETVYAVNLVPLGGYCAMEGEEEASGDEKAFCNKKPWRRFLIVIMGAIFNLLLGVIIIGCTLIPQERFTTTTIAEFHENSVSSEHGLKVDDKIIAVNGRRIFSTYDLSYAFTNVKNSVIDMTVLRDGEKLDLENVKFDSKEIDGIDYLSVDFYVYGKEKNFVSFIGETFNTTFSYCAVVWRSLIDLITGKYGISAVSGPVGVTAVIGSIAKQNLQNLLPIMALITVNLGIFNLLPVPALDGGRLVFILFEMIFKKPVPQKYESAVHAAGFILLIGFMLLITAKDIWTLFMG
ncbi:MAG: site-2 protease family protein [Ruminococcaceae bacterium]|nr:site-2 protease family protein [Oscillospiraceae bacterium]